MIGDQAEAVETAAGVPEQRQASGGGAADRAAGGRAGGRAEARAEAKRARRRGKRWLRVLAYTAAGLMVVTVGTGGYLYYRYNGNIKSSPLFAGENGDAGHEVPDAFGRTPINVLVIGSDSRDNPEDCAIGGDCGEGANADVELLLHVSADRSNATVMSIPRDLMTDLPGCIDKEHNTSSKKHRGQINSSLQYGPGCTVAAVHQLTDIPIDHFVKVDFSGVIKMSDAVGGVPVCVSDNVYDPYSHLKLAQGTHTLKGMAALQFVRTRHGFGDGGDLGRASAQHAFLGSMIRQLKSAGTLTDPTKVLGLADAATKALTVDPGLDGITKLVGLADDLNKVPSARVTFTTMQTAADPRDKDRLVAGADAAKLFATIKNDQPLTAGPAGATAAPSTPPPAAPSATAPAAPPASGPARRTINVVVRNGTGLDGRAGAVADALRQAGFGKDTTTGRSTTADRTAVHYPAGREAEAQQVAAALGVPADAVQAGSGSSIELVIGADWPSGTAFPATAGRSAPSVDPSAALKGADATTADTTGSCTAVSHENTVSLPGYGGMTPVQAYARSKNVPDSAP
ncbi:LCP family protein [Streptomyces sp. TLI_171]|uniref:LCP family protein n=1 Tax=Streptomyces sp. TLI_171 TaxID=1938859 RepID=UPI000C5FD566|nr:LCP family protein [Streptomyces sp. TLI_171]RKE20480.1 LytR family transcriptional attenuator [Streptomyces sp. TLI_171]